MLGVDLNCEDGEWGLKLWRRAGDGDRGHGDRVGIGTVEWDGYGVHWDGRG